MALSHLMATFCQRIVMKLSITVDPMAHDSQFIQCVKHLLTKANCSPRITCIQPCKKGGNNRTYQLITEQGKFLLKQYFKKTGDPRDRLQAEYAFLSYAHPIANHFTPKPYAFDRHHALALYEFIDGEAIADGTPISSAMLQQAIDFFRAINQRFSLDKAKQAHSLMNASEACFSITDHLLLIDARIARLKTALNTSIDNDDQAKAMMDKLATTWKTLKLDCQRSAQDNHIRLDEQLPWQLRCVSPSDFGFHNAMMCQGNELRFIDFEYAGWDDPAKMVSDFFSQLAVPVPITYFVTYSYPIVDNNFSTLFSCCCFN